MKSFLNKIIGSLAGAQSGASLKLEQSVRFRNTALAFAALGIAFSHGCSEPNLGEGVAGGGVAAQGPPPKVGELSHAVYRNDLASVQTLIERGADINENIGSEEHRITPLIIATVYGYNEISKILTFNRASTSPSYYGYSARDFAFYQDNEEIVRLIDNGVKK